MEEKKNTVTEEQFKAWLDSDRIEPIKLIARYETSAIFLKAPKGKDFFYLYKQRLYGNDEIVRHKNFEYAGLYSLKQGLIYERDYDLNGLYPNITSGETLSSMKDKVIAGVRACVEEKLGNDPINLELKELPMEYEQRLERHRGGIENDAAQKFIFGYGSKSIRYQCEYSFHEWTDDALLEYISEPESFIHKEAEQYLQEKQADILFQFKRNELLRKEMEKIESKTDSRLHRQRGIVQALLPTDAKKVVVTIDKEGKRFSFKYEARSLSRIDWRFFYVGDLVKQDRDEFTRLFGIYGSFQPEDIVDISYRGKSLYSAEPYIPEQEQEQGPVQGM